MSAEGIVTNIDGEYVTIDMTADNGATRHTTQVNNSGGLFQVGDVIALDNVGRLQTVNAVDMSDQNITVDYSLSTGIDLSSALTGDLRVDDGSNIIGISEPPAPADMLYREHIVDPRTGIMGPPSIEPIFQTPPNLTVDRRDPDRMIVNAIAAIGENNQLALNNRLPWNYPEDLELFHEKIEGKTVIMGRGTWESLPSSFYELPENIIIVSTTMDDSDTDNVHIADNVAEAVGIADDIGSKEVWICGGVQIYKEALEQELIEELHISHIPYEGEADRYFPNFVKYIYEVKEGTTIECEGQKSFVYKVYEMKEHTGELFVSGLVDPPPFRGPGVAINGAPLEPADVVSVEYDNNASTLTATNIQDALEELDNNFGQPDTMVMNPNVFRTLVNDSVSGVEYTTEENASRPGQMYYNTVDNNLYLIGEDGQAVMISNIAHEDASDHEVLEAICHETAERFMAETDRRIDQESYHALDAMLTNAIRSRFNEARVRTNVSVDNSVAPVYTMGSSAAIDYSPGYANTTLSVTVELLYNSYNIELQLR